MPDTTPEQSQQDAQQGPSGADMYPRGLSERENYRRILEYSVDGIYQTSRAGQIIYANQSLADLFGYANPSEMKTHIREVSRDIYRDPQDRARFLERLRTHGEVKGFECEMYARDGTSVWVRQNARAVLDDQGQIQHIIGTVANISAYRRSELARRQAESDYERLFNTAQAGLYQSLPSGHLCRANQMFARILGYDSPQTAREMISDLGREVYVSQDARAELLQQLEQQGRVSNQRVRFKRCDGTLIWVLLSAQYIDRESAEEAVIEGSILDITEQVQAEDEIRFLAEHDALTRLPNRSRFQTELFRVDTAQDSEAVAFVVIFMDLDHFKDINDTLGHLVGDALLLEIARRLQQPFPVSCQPFRLGGDEFAILVRDALTPEALHELCTELCHRISQEYRHDDNHLKVTASLGVVRSDQLPVHRDSDLAEEVMRAADLALYSCKRSGRAGYHLFEQSMQRQLQAEKALENRLEQALASNELQLCYQPIYSTRRRTITGVEALLRWPAPEGMISPGEFIPLAERSGLIAEIDAWVIRTVVAQCSALTAHQPDLRINFNLSAHHFNYNSLDQLLAPVTDELDRWGHNLGIELTERVMFEHTDQVITALQALRQRGIHISLDDFGTGYSSLSYLTRLPVDKLKVDQSFILEMDSNSTAMAVVQAAAQIGKTLNLTVNAEGIETGDQFAFVCGLGIDEVQGYHLAYPMPLQDLLSLLARQQAE